MRLTILNFGIISTILLESMVVLHVSAQNVTVPQVNKTAPMTVQDIVKSTGMDAETVTSILTELQQQDAQEQAAALAENSTSSPLAAGSPDAPGNSTTPDKKHKSNVVSRFILGAGRAASQMVAGTFDMIGHPIQSAKGLVNTALHPIKTGRTIINNTAASWKKDRAGTAGEITANVLAFAAPIGGKASQILKPGTKAMQVADVQLLSQGGKVEAIASAASKAEGAAAAGAAGAKTGFWANIRNKFRRKGKATGATASAETASGTSGTASTANQAANVAESATTANQAGNAAVAANVAAATADVASDYVSLHKQFEVTRSTLQKAESHLTELRGKLHSRAPGENMAAVVDDIKATKKTITESKASLVSLEQRMKDVVAVDLNKNGLKDALVKAGVQDVESLKTPVFPALGNAQTLDGVTVAALNDFKPLAHKATNPKWYNPKSWGPGKMAEADIAMYKSYAQAATKRYKTVADIYKKLPEGPAKTEFAKIVTRDRVVSQQANRLSYLAQRGWKNTIKADPQAALVNIGGTAAMGATNFHATNAYLQQKGLTLPEERARLTRTEEEEDVVPGELTTTSGNMATEEIQVPVA